MGALGLAESMGAGARQPRRGYHHDRPLVAEHLELTPLGSAGLVDVPGEDELGAGCRELLEHPAAARQRSLACAPGSVRQLVMKANDAQGSRRRRGEPIGSALNGVRLQPSRLVSPRPHGVDADNVQPVGRVHRLRRLPLALELLPRSREPRGRQQRDVVVARHRQHLRRQAPQQRRDTLVLIAPAAVREVARRDHEIRLNTFDEGPEGAVDKGLLAGSEMDVGDVDQACRHSRGRLYTGLVTDESNEIFDDLYLGLRAGGAIRKQRRGEPLTMEEEAALGHWQRLSNWRKVIAVGAFALGTFGLGFTIGGIVFGRRRNA
jgi:hypothetical protein